MVIPIENVICISRGNRNKAKISYSYINSTAILMIIVKYLQNFMCLKIIQISYKNSGIIYDFKYFPDNFINSIQKVNEFSIFIKKKC